jgi:hypothetical protein
VHMRRRHHVTRLAGALLILALAGCTATQPAVPVADAPGLLLGLWHGFIAPVAFLASIFLDGLRIYAFPNGGLWYDLGFMLGISGFSGGVFAGSRRSQSPAGRGD